MDAYTSESALARASELVDQVADELVATDVVVRTIEALVTRTEQAVAICAGSRVALEVTRVAITLVRAEIDYHAAA